MLLPLLPLLPLLLPLAAVASNSMAGSTPTRSGKKLVRAVPATWQQW